MNAVDDGVYWQIAMYRRLGYKNYIQVGTPGVGSRPSDYTKCINSYLTAGCDNAYNTTAGATTYWKMAQDMPANLKPNVVLGQTGIGQPGSGGCVAGDANYALTDTAISGFSGPRLIGYYAAKFGFYFSGETDGVDRGGNTANYNVVVSAATQLKSCNGFFLNYASWTPNGITDAQYGQIIQAYQY